MLDAALDAQDVVSLNRPHLPPTDSETVDKDGDADVAAALLVLLPDVDPPSGQSWQEGHQGAWDLRPPPEDIMRPHPRHSMKTPRTRTSRKGLQIGMRVILAVSVSRKVIPARRAPNI